MNLKLTQTWIPLSRVEALIQYEPALIILGLFLGAWIIYKVFLPAISEARHRNLKGLFSNLVRHLFVWILLFVAYWLTQRGLELRITNERFPTYVGLITLVWSAIVFVKTCRILMFEYLFLGHMREGVPVLLVNLFTLLLAISLGGWLATEILNVNLAPVLATSAMFSLVLGLALQDTLGNLFAGIALQLDKPYELGDWIEVQSGIQKRIGRVHEISWRATVLLGLSDESLTIPNRVMSQAEVSNFSLRERPIFRSHVFRIPFGASISKVKSVLLEAAATVSAIRKFPTPEVLLNETTESWISCKLVYAIDDYGAQFEIGNQVLTAAVDALEAADLRPATQRVAIAFENASAELIAKPNGKTPQ